jgi:hypothetical protein
MSGVNNWYKKAQLLEQLGDVRQVCGFQRMELLEGKGKGNEIIQVRNGSGLQFQINVSRGFDIGLCEFYGIPISWISHTGPVSPYYYDKEGTEWNRSFEGGLLATCGLTYMGKPGWDLGKPLGQHGRISSTPAELLQTEGRWMEERYELIFRAKIRESKALEENIVSERTIATSLGDNRIFITDRITNESFAPVEHMVMYHYNFGYPVIGSDCRIEIPQSKKRWIIGEGPIEGSDRYSEPIADASPTVMLHEELQSDDEDMIHVSIANNVVHNNKHKRLFVKLSYPKASCSYLTQWKYPAKGTYVMGIEPCNSTTEGRSIHRERGTLPFLQPGETKQYSFSLEFQLQEEQL